MKIVFLGTPEAAVPSLEALVEAGHEVVTVVTRPDRRRGRGGELSPSPIKQAAQQLGLPVVHRLSDLEGLDADLGVVVAYGALLPGSLLERLPMVNVHFSLLPRWRGAAPVERALLAGDDETGVCLMGLEETLDTGPIYATAKTSIGEKTVHELLHELAELGAELLVATLASEGGLGEGTPQHGEATYAKKLTTEDFRLLPSSSAAYLSRQVRLGRAFTFIGGRRIRVLSAHVVNGVSVAPGQLALLDTSPLLGSTDGALQLQWVQEEGKRRSEASEWWRGARLNRESTSWGEEALSL